MMAARRISSAPHLTSGDRPVLLNVGCGQTFHADWVNVDVVPAAAEVQRWDVLRGLPFRDRSFDACYCSHMLEHLRPTDAARTLEEMFRVLRPGAVVRVVVPDLRRIAQQYLALLAAVDSGNHEREADYDWIMLELLDQAVRDSSGGEMARFLRRQDLPNRDFIRARIGEEAERFWRQPDTRDGMPRLPEIAAQLARGWKRVGTRAVLAYAMTRLIGGPRVALAFREGLYRQQGEIHRWMYDRFSLGRLLRRAGFASVTDVPATRSAIPDFARYLLDIDTHGQVRKPDSLFMEGVRPPSGELGG